MRSRLHSTFCLHIMWLMGTHGLKAFLGIIPYFSFNLWMLWIYLVEIKRGKKPSMLTTSHLSLISSNFIEFLVGWKWFSLYIISFKNLFIAQICIQIQNSDYNETRSCKWVVVCRTCSIGSLRILSLIVYAVTSLLISVLLFSILYYLPFLFDQFFILLKCYYCANLYFSFSFKILLIFFQETMYKPWKVKPWKRHPSIHTQKRYLTQHRIFFQS